MEPADFVSIWSAYCSRTGLAAKFPLTRPLALGPAVSGASARFLTEAGLPDGAGLAFGPAEAMLKPVSDVYGMSGAPGDWDPSTYGRLRGYAYLGQTEGGDPICLDMAGGERVVFLDHERFLDPGLSGWFVNSGVSQLAECILIFQEMVEACQGEQGEEAELYEGGVPSSLVEQALPRMGASDPEAVKAGRYWPVAMEYI